MAKAKPGTKKVKQKNTQVNQYDKILRENMEAALPGLIKNLLNIHVANTEELPDDIQHTKERKPDVLKKVTDKKGIPLCCISNSKRRTSRKWYSGWRSII